MLVFAFSLIASVAQAQPVETGSSPTRAGKGRLYGGVGWGQVGTQQLTGLGDVEAAFENAGLPFASGPLLFTGGGGYFRINRFIVGGQGGGLGSSAQSDAGWRTWAGGGYGLLDLGYVVADVGPVMVYPRVGLGGGGVSWKVAPKTAPSFQEVLDAPARATDIGSGGPMVQLALAADWFIDFDPDPLERGGILVGVRGGYTMGFPVGDWSADGAHVKGGPDVGVPQGAFINVAIGGGGMTEY
jgi:hypothetical protein